MNLEPQKNFIGLMDFFSVLPADALPSYQLMDKDCAGGALCQAHRHRSVDHLPVREPAVRPSCPSALRELMAEADEKHSFPLVPTEEQKKRAHPRIELFAMQPPPEWCLPASLKPERRQMFS